MAAGPLNHSKKGLASLNAGQAAKGRRGSEGYWNALIRVVDPHNS